MEERGACRKCTCCAVAVGVDLNPVGDGSAPAVISEASSDPVSYGIPPNQLEARCLAISPSPWLQCYWPLSRVSRIVELDRNEHSGRVSLQTVSNRPFRPCQPFSSQ